MFDRLETLARNLCELKYLLKSEYGPKGGGQYDPKDNIKRKENRVAERYENVGPNKAAHRYTTSGSTTDRARVEKEFKVAAKKQRKGDKGDEWSNIHPDERKKDPRYLKLSDEGKKLIDSVPHAPKTK